MDELIYKEVFEDIQNFYDRVEQGLVPGISYRDDQRTLSYNVLDSIYNDTVLIQEAGVGSGKTMGYLVPLLFTYKRFKEHGKTPKGFILSTSSIALQEQLKAELEHIESLLGVKTPVVIAKGKNNYVCLANAYSYLKSANDTRFKKTIEERIARSDPGNPFSRNRANFDKNAYSDISPLAWESINVSNLNCRSCNYSYECPYQLQRADWAKGTKIIIANHDMLIESQKKDYETAGAKRPLHVPSYVVLDEAHTLEEKVINAYAKEYTSKKVVDDFNLFNHVLDPKSISRLIIQSNTIFDTIRRNANATMNKRKEETVTDEGRYPFTITPTTKKNVQDFIVLFDEFYRYIDSIDEVSRGNYLSKDQKFAFKRLAEYRNMLVDMVQPFDKRNNIFWVTFLPGEKNKVNLCSVDKNIPHLAARLLKEKGYGKLFTSATLSTGKTEDGEADFSYFMSSIGLTPNEFRNTEIVLEEPIKSPYDYDNNTLMYISTTAVSPRDSSHDDYIESISSEIDSLMRSSHGRSLILFTSKTDMQAVYDKLKNKDYGFNLIIQNENNSDASKQEFISDQDSCLFSTGFWEGIDIKGDSLQQVIIPKLPFPVVDPIVDSKAKEYGGITGFSKVYLPSMLIDLKQGTGRLIRGESDIGVVSILDSRIIPNGYKGPIEDALPFSNVTTNPDDVKEFFNEKQNTKK